MAATHPEIVRLGQAQQALDQWASGAHSAQACSADSVAYLALGFLAFGCVCIGLATIDLALKVDGARDASPFQHPLHHLLGKADPARSEPIDTKSP